MLGTVIIENEPHAFHYLNDVLHRELPQIHVLGHATTVVDGIALVREKNPEIVFLDIELNDGMGFEILDRLDEQNFEVVFTTGFDHYLEAAMKHFAFSYLLKPVAPEALKEVIHRYEQRRQRFYSQSKYGHLQEFYSGKNSKILLHTGEQHVSVAIDDIIYCKADGNYTEFFLQNKTKHLASNILKHFDSLLGPRGFFRANRSCLINIAHIATIFKKETIVLDNGEKIHVSSRNKAQLSQLIDSLS